MKKKLKEKRGITLIALVITIIVLLILAGVSIAMLTGDNGILQQANNAKEKMNQESALEKVKVELLGSYDEQLIVNEDLFKKNIKENLNIKEEDIAEGKNNTITIKVDNYEIFVDMDEKIVELKSKAIPGVEVKKIQKDNYTDSDNNIATIPEGFTVDEEENKINTGLVVRGPEGSEFIWIPVNDINDMAQCSSAGGKCKLKMIKGNLKCHAEEHSETSEEIVGKLYSTTMGEVFGNVNSTYNPNSGMREPASVTTYDNNPEYNTIGLTVENLKKEYKEMAESVARFGGFYLGRYESSLSDATETEEGKNGTIQSKNGVIVSRACDTETSKWYGLYAKQKEYTGKNNSVTSSMIWGSQYDAMVNWVIKSNSTDKEKLTSTGNAAHDLSAICPSGKQTVTGKYDKINNIYDLEGNVYEWTLEAYSTTSRVCRGGFCGKSHPPISRDYNGARYTTNTMGSRMTLFINKY